MTTEGPPQELVALFFFNGQGMATHGFFDPRLADEEEAKLRAVYARVVVERYDRRQHDGDQEQQI